MLDRITATFDDLYSPTALAADRQPPSPTRAFFAYFLRQFRGALYARFLLVAAGSVVDAMLPVFVGWTVGMLSTTPPGAALRRAFAARFSSCSPSCSSARSSSWPTRWSATTPSPPTSSTSCAGRATGT